MPRNISRPLVTIAGGLALLYLVAFFIYLKSYIFVAFQRHAAVISILYLALFLICFPAIQLKEWARKLLILINLVMCVYFLGLSLKYLDFIHPSFILMNIIAILYFSQPIVKVQYQPGWKFSRKSILIVDDDEGVLKTVKRILLPNGYSVLGATTGERGMQVAKMQKPDLIILDVILPGIKGRELCTRLKSDPETKNIPVMFLTAKDSPDDIEAEMAVGAVSHLTKPVNSKALLAEIKRVLG